MTQLLNRNGDEAKAENAFKNVFASSKNSRVSVGCIFSFITFCNIYIPRRSYVLSNQRQKKKQQQNKTKNKKHLNNEFSCQIFDKDMNK